MKLSNLLAGRREAEQRAIAVADQFKADIGALQKRISETNDLIEDARIAPVDASTIRVRATALVDSVLAEVRARSGLLDSLAAPGDRFNDNDAGVAAENLSAFQLAALADRTNLIETLSREGVSASQDVGKPTTEANRAATIAKLTDELRSLGAAEELLLRSLETTGVAMPRRSDADVELVVAVDDDLQRLAEGEA